MMNRPSRLLFLPLPYLLPLWASVPVGPAEGAELGVGLAAGATVMVRRTAALSRPVRGSLATSVMTFAPGTRPTRTLKRPSASAVVLGFCRRPSVVMVE